MRSLPLAFGWRHLCFANWPVDEAVLDAHLPDAFAVDTFDGTGWLTVVPFTNVETRPRGLPPWAGVRLPELNLRSYVTVDGGTDHAPEESSGGETPRDGEPGVYFHSLDADGLAAVLGARLTHALPYYYADVDFSWADGRVRFESRRRHPGARPARFAGSYRPTGEAFTPEPGTRAHFLTERRRLYTQGQDGTVRYTDVDHPRWTLYPAEWSVAANTLFEANGFARPEGDPVLYYSPGVDVVTGPSQRWGGEREGRQTTAERAVAEGSKGWTD